MENLPSIFLDTLHVLTHKVLTRTLWGRCYYYAYFCNVRARALKTSPKFCPQYNNYFTPCITTSCFPGGASRESTCQCRRCGFDTWIRKIPWNRKQQSSPVFLPGIFHGQRRQAGYSPRGHREVDTTERLTTHTHTHTHITTLQMRKQPHRN